MAGKILQEFEFNFKFNDKDASKSIKAISNDMKKLSADATVLKGLVEYIKKVDAALNDFKTKNKDLFNQMFGSLDTELTGALSELFGVLDSDMTALDGLKQKVQNAAGNSKTKLETLRNIAEEINDLYVKMGAQKPIDIDAMFMGKGSKKAGTDFASRIKILNDAINGFAVNFQDAQQKLKGDFSIGSTSNNNISEIGEVVKDNANELKLEIDNLEKQLDRLKKVQKDANTALASATKASLGDNVFEAGTAFSVDQVKQVVEEFITLKDTLNNFGDDHTSIEYFETLAKYMQKAAEVADIYSNISVPTSKSYSVLQKLNQDKDKSGKSYGKILKSAYDTALGVIDYGPEMEALESIDDVVDATNNKLATLQTNLAQINIAKTGNGVAQGFVNITKEADKASKAAQRVMYHLGNLFGGGQARDTFEQMPENLTSAVRGDRWEKYGFGVLGGGLFGVADPSAITQEPGKSTFIQSIDLSKYNMYMADTEERAISLIDFLSKLQKFSMKSAAPDYTGFDKDLQGIGLDTLYDQFKVVFEQSDLTKEKFQNFINEMVMLLKQAGLEFDSKTGELDFKNISKEIANSENISTRFMKMLGFEGVYSGTTSIGGFGQGSVLFDFKKEDIVGYFDTIQAAIQDYQKIVSQIDGKPWVGSAEQLQQYAKNLDNIITKLESSPFYGKGTGGIDDTLKQLYQIKDNINNILFGEGISDKGSFETITTGITSIDSTVDKAKAQVQEFLDLVDEIYNQNFNDSWTATDNVKIGQYTERLNSAKKALDELGNQGQLTAEQLVQIDDAFNRATEDLKSRTKTYFGYGDGHYSEGYSDGRQSAQEEIDQLHDENESLREQLSKAQQNVNQLAQSDSDIDPRENANLEQRLELLREIADEYGAAITQKDRSRLEELNDKSVNTDLTEKEEIRLFELQESIDDADEKLNNLSETYDKIILKLDNGKKIDILPDDAGLRALNRIATEYYDGEYNGSTIEDVIFVRNKEQEIVAQTNQELQKQLQTQEQINSVATETTLSRGDSISSPDKDKEIKTTMSDNSDVNQENVQYQQLLQTIRDVEKAVNDKTAAFKNEAEAVDTAVHQEIKFLDELKEELEALKTDIESIFNQNNTNALSSVINEWATKIVNISNAIKAAPTAIENLSTVIQPISDMLSQMAIDSQSLKKNLGGINNNNAQSNVAQNQKILATFYHGSKTPLNNMNYDASKGKGMHNLGDGLYLTPNLELAAKHGKNILQQNVDMDKIFILTKEFITDIDALYQAMGQIKPKDFDWTALKGLLHTTMQDPKKSKDFAMQMQKMGYHGVYSKGYGYADPEAEQIVLYDDKYKNGLSTTPYKDIQISSESTLATQQAITAEIEKQKNLGNQFAGHEVKQAVEDKTAAFQEEATIVDSTVAQEIATLSKLEDYLKQIKQAVQNVFGNQPTDVLQIDDTKLRAEIDSLKELQSLVDQVTAAVERKTDAFHNEAVIVGASVSQELASLQKLKDELNVIQNSIRNVMYGKQQTLDSMSGDTDIAFKSTNSDRSEIDDAAIAAIKAKIAQLHTVITNDIQPIDGDIIQTEASDAAQSIDQGKKILVDAFTRYYNAVEEARKMGVSVLNGGTTIGVENAESAIKDLFFDWDFDEGAINHFIGLMDNIIHQEIDVDDIRGKIDGIFNVFEKHGNPIQIPLLNISDDRDDLEIDLSELESISRRSSQGMTSDLTTVEDKTVDVNSAFQELINYISQSGVGPKTFFTNLETGAMLLDEKLSGILTSLNLIDSYGNVKFTTPKSGSDNKGGMISDEYALIARPIEKAQFAQMAQPKLFEAEKEGASVGTILGIFTDEVNGLVYELQKTVQGAEILNQQHQLNNPDFLNATEKQLQKFIQDLLVFQKNGLYIDQNGKNILYDKNKGFSVVDFFSASVPGLTVGKENSVQQNVNAILSSIQGALSKNDYDAFSQKLYDAMNKIVGGANASSGSSALQSVEQQTQNVSNAFKELISYISQSGTNPGTFFDKLEAGAQKVDAELQNILQSLNLIDSNGNINLSSISSGFTNQGGFVSDQYTMIARPDYYLQKIQDLQPLLANAKQMGAQIGAIFDIIEDKSKGLIYEVQNTVAGEAAFSHHKNTINTDILNATDNQIKDLINTLKILQQNGLFVDWGGDNVLYDKDKGFSIIDLGTKGGKPHTVSQNNTIQENLDRFAKELFKFTPSDMYAQVQSSFVDRLNKIANTSDGNYSAVTGTIKNEEVAREQNTDAINAETQALQRQNQALEAQIALKKQAQSMKWEEFALDESSLDLKNQAGFQTISDLEKFWKNANYNKEIDFHEISKWQAKEIINKKLPSGLASKWYTSADFSAKDKLENEILADNELRNACLNYLYSLYMSNMPSAYKKSDNLSFKDFLDTEFTVFRGDEAPLIYGDESKLSFTFNRNISKGFDSKNLGTAKIKPKNTIGNAGSGFESEVETFIPSDQTSWFNKTGETFADFYSKQLPKVQEEIDIGLINLEKKRVSDLLGDTLSTLAHQAGGESYFKNNILSQFTQGAVPDTLKTIGDGSYSDTLAQTYNDLSDMQKKLVAYYASLDSMSSALGKQFYIASNSSYTSKKMVGGDAGLFNAVLSDPSGTKQHVASLTGELQYKLFEKNDAAIKSETESYQQNTQAIRENTDAQNALNNAKQNSSSPDLQKQIFDETESYYDVLDKLQDAEFSSGGNSDKKNFMHTLSSKISDVHWTNKFDKEDGLYYSYEDNIHHDANEIFDYVQMIEDQCGENLDYVKEYLQQVYKGIDLSNIKKADPTHEEEIKFYDDDDYKFDFRDNPSSSPKYSVKDYEDAYKLQSSAAQDAINDLAVFYQKYTDTKAKVESDPIEFLIGPNNPTLNEQNEVLLTFNTLQAKMQEIADMQLIDTEDDQKRLQELQLEAINLQNKLRSAQIDGATSFDYGAAYGLSIGDATQLKKLIDGNDVYSVVSDLEAQLYQKQERALNSMTTGLKDMIDSDASDTIEAFMTRLANQIQKIDVFDATNMRDANDNVMSASLQPIQSILEQIYGVLRGFTGIESDAKNSIKYSEPVVDTGIGENKLSEQDFSILNSILQAIQEISNYLHSIKFDNTPEQTTGNIEQDKQESVIYQLLASKLPSNIASDDTLAAIKTVIEQLVQLSKAKDTDQDFGVKEAVTPLIDSLSNVVQVLQRIANNLDTNVQAVASGSTPPPDNRPTAVATASNPPSNEPPAADGGTPPPENPDETVSLKRLLEYVNKIKKAVNEKTKAFENEGKTVENVVTQEINSLQKLIDKLAEVKAAVDGKTDAFKDEKGAVDDATKEVKEKQPKKADKSSAVARITDPNQYKQLSDIAASSVSDLGSDVQIKGLKALADGAVRVEGAFKNANGTWEGFIADINESNQIIDHAIDKESAYAKALNNTSEALKKQKIKDNAQLNDLLKQSNEVYKSLKIDPLDTSDSATAVRDLRTKLNTTIEQYKKQKTALTEEELDGLKQIYAQLMANAKAYAEQNEKANQTKQKTYGSSMMMNRTAQYNSLQSKVNSDSALASSSVLTNAMNKYEESWNKLQGLYKQLQDTPNPTEDDQVAFKEASAECNKLGKEVEKLFKTYDKMRNDSNVVTTVGLEDYNNRAKELRDYVEATYGASATIGDFKNNYNELEFTIDNGNGTFTKAKVAVDNLRTSIIETAGDTQTATSRWDAFVGELKGKFRSISTYLVSMTSIQEVWQQVRRGVQYVREIDAALTELKKVTDETNATYDVFLQTMSKTAGEVGSTVSELTTMAAEWARLGYSIEDAGKLAESTAILLNVSEFESATDASQALISTMQAFGYVADDSQHVVDILNEVGKLIAQVI